MKICFSAFSKTILSNFSLSSVDWGHLSLMRRSKYQCKICIFISSSHIPSDIKRLIWFSLNKINKRTDTTNIYIYIYLFFFLLFFSFPTRKCLMRHEIILQEEEEKIKKLFPGHRANLFSFHNLFSFLPMNKKIYFEILFLFIFSRFFSIIFDFTSKVIVWGYGISS